MVEINMYGVYTSLKEARDELRGGREEWLKKFPHELTDVDFTRKEEAFFKTRDLKNRMRDLDILHNDLRESAAMTYAISKLIEEITGQCKMSSDITRSHIARIHMTAEQIKEGDARAKVRFEEELDVEDEKLTVDDLMVCRKDYVDAKAYLESITREYAKKIVPKQVSIRVMFGDLHRQDPIGKRAQAWAYGNKTWTKSMVVFDTTLIKVNVYNMKSKFFDALSIHELCHVRHGYQEPGIDNRYVHTRPLYYYCFEEFPFAERWMANPETHPG